MINRMCATTIWCRRKRRKPAENPIVNHRKRNTMVEMIQRSAKIIRIICMHQGCTAAAVAALFSCSHEPMSLSRCDPKCVCVPHSHLLNFLSLKIYLNSFLFASIAGCGELRCSVGFSFSSSTSSLFAAIFSQYCFDAAHIQRDTRLRSEFEPSAWIFAMSTWFLFEKYYLFRLPCAQRLVCPLSTHTAGNYPPWRALFYTCYVYEYIPLCGEWRPFCVLRLFYLKI